MPHVNWLIKTYLNSKKNAEKMSREIRFWNSFYEHVIKSQLSGEHVKSKSLQYKEEVFSILFNEKERLAFLNDDELRKIQLEIENLTMVFDEESMFKTVPNLIKILIGKNVISAKDYLRCGELDKDDIELLSEFGQYTIEALIIHVLSMVYSPLDNTMVRVASLVEQLESYVRRQALLLKSRRCKKEQHSLVADDVFQVKMSDKEKKRSKLEKMYPFGTGLVQFMEEREMITLICSLNGSVRVKKKRGAYFLPSNLYVVCNFDVSLLPIKLNLPMVCKPLDWTSACMPGQPPVTLSDLTGGYLSGPTGEMYDRYRLLSSGDISHFYIDIGRDDNYEKLCCVMNKLQGQAFQINSRWLQYIEENENRLVEEGLLMPRFLSFLNIKDVSTLLREFMMKNSDITKLCNFNELFATLCKNIQRSRYEHLIIKLAKAYDGYKFYLPAFVDFRGRIYRSGILHFHERDLARSLILFADCETEYSVEYLRTFVSATAFHYQSFASVKETEDWFNTVFLGVGNDAIEFSSRAKRPFQFLANIQQLTDGNLKYINRIPITQDASASAYQIMSYFLLDESMAKKTNLFPSEDGIIQDVYSFFLEELKEFMKGELESNLSTIVSNHLTRKLVKGIFMPLIYGKTLMSTASDLKDHLSHYITHKECYEVASVCFKFWRTKYQGMECLIRLIRHIGWLASARDSPVFYRVPYFTTVQDYMIMEPINIWVYDRLHKKRRRVTLRVSSSKRDRRKTEISTFVNFIHQRDAHIAMSVVDLMLSMKAPIYTVHDNFITTVEYSERIPRIYSHCFREMGPPLSIINEFIYMNVIKPIVKRELHGPTEGYFSRKVISKELLNYYLHANVPENISKKMKATWEERISGILTSYENYTRIVCGDFLPPKDCWLAHEKKWDKFHYKLINKNKEIPSYCVHY